MTTLSNQDALVALGLEGLPLSSDDTRFEWTTSERSQALGAGDVVALAFSALAATGFVDVPFSTVQAASLGRLDAAVSAADLRVLRVSAPADVGLSLHVPAGMQEADVAYVPEEDPGTAYVDLSRATAVVVRAGDDTVFIRASGAGLVVRAVSPAADALPPLVAPAEVPTWLDACPDAWLANQVRPLASADGAWTRVVAAGMLARLAMPVDGRDAQTRLAAFERREIDDSLAGPRRWARALSAEQRRVVAMHALAECAALRLDLDDVREAVHVSRDGWEDDLREVAQRRDDLEGVLVLLDAAQATAALRRGLEAVDRAGELLALAVPAGTELQDERLRRAGLKDPDAWWARAA